MTPEDKTKKIEEISSEASQKIQALGKKRQDIIREYIKELETKKIDTIRASIVLPDNN